jgi:hypothetical protein
MMGIALAVALVILSAICGARAEDSKGPSSNLKQDGPLTDRPDTLPPDVMRDPGTTATGHHADHNITRPRTRDDVLRDIFRGRPSDTPSDPPKP